MRRTWHGRAVFGEAHLGREITTVVRYPGVFGPNCSDGMKVQRLLADAVLLSHPHVRVNVIFRAELRAILLLFPELSITAALFDGRKVLLPASDLSATMLRRKGGAIYGIIKSVIILSRSSITPRPRACGSARVARK